MSRRYDPEDPRYQDRFEAAIELLKLWRDTVGPNLTQPGPLADLHRWTETFLKHPAIPELSDTPK